MSSWMWKKVWEILCNKPLPSVFVQLRLARKSAVVSDTEGSLLPLLKLGIFQENKLAFLTTHRGKINCTNFLSRPSTKYLYDVSLPQFYVHFYPSHACQVGGPLETLLKLFWTGLKLFWEERALCLPCHSTLWVPTFNAKGPHKDYKDDPIQFPHLWNSLYQWAVL